MRVEDRDVLLQYILGEMSADEAAQIDQRLLKDEAFADSMEEARFDLLDAYATRHLEPNMRERVERAFGSTDIALSAAFQQALAKVPAGKASRAPWMRRWQFAFAASCVAVVAIFLILSLRLGRRAAQPEQVRSNVGLSSGSSVVPDSTAPSPSREFVLLLSPKVLRGEAAVRRVAIPAGATSIKCQIVIPDAQAHYSVRIETTAGRNVEAFSDLSPGRLGGTNFIQFSIPQAALPPETYRFLVSRGKAGQERPSYAYPVQILAPPPKPTDR